MIFAHSLFAFLPPEAYQGTASPIEPPMNGASPGPVVAELKLITTPHSADRRPTLTQTAARLLLEERGVLRREV